MNRLKYKHEDIKRILLELSRVKDVKIDDKMKELCERAGVSSFEIREPRHSTYGMDGDYRTFELKTDRDLLIRLSSTRLSFHAPNSKEVMVLLESHPVSSKPYTSELADYLNDYFLRLDTEISFFFSILEEEKERERKNIIYRILGDNLLCKKK